MKRSARLHISIMDDYDFERASALNKAICDVLLNDTLPDEKTLDWKTGPYSHPKRFTQIMTTAWHSIVFYQYCIGERKPSGEYSESFLNLIELSEQRPGGVIDYICWKGRIPDYKVEYHDERETLLNCINFRELLDLAYQGRCMGEAYDLLIRARGEKGIAGSLLAPRLDETIDYFRGRLVDGIAAQISRDTDLL